MSIKSSHVVLISTYIFMYLVTIPTVLRTLGIASLGKWVEFFRFDPSYIDRVASPDLH